MAPDAELENTGSDATQEHPDALPSSQEPQSPFGERNENLPEQIVRSIKNAVREFQQQEQYVRRREVMRDRRNRFYELGYQHIYENSRNGSFVQAQAGQSVNIGGTAHQCPNYIDDYNIFQPYLRILEAILTQNPPGIDFRSINPNLAEDVEAAQTAEGYRKIFDRANKVKSIQTQIVRMMGLSGRTVIWTRTEANGQKFGFDSTGQPKKMETATVHGTLESRVPILAKSQEDALYCILFDDIDVKQAKAEYPEIRDKIKPAQSGIGESAYERMARLGALQGTSSFAQMGDAFSHLVTREHCWLRPASFEGEQCDEIYEPVPMDDGSASWEPEPEPDGSPAKLRTAIQQIFPLGVHVVFVGEEYAGSWAESMDDAIVIGFPYEGDGMFRLCLMNPMIVVQDSFSDDMNSAREVWDMGWPSTWVNAEDDEYDAIVDQRADPYAIRQKKLPTGAAKMEDQFFREPNPELPATFVQFLELLQGPLPQFMIATPPALFGDQESANKTASGYAQARAQALGQQGLTWAAIQDMMARMYYQAALCASKNPDHSEEIVVPSGSGGTNAVRLERLTKGKFGAYPDEDSSFPESTSQKRAAFNGILAQAEQAPAIGAQIMSSPENWKTYAQLNGFPELHIPEAEARDKQVFEIEKLLQGTPVPDPDAVKIAEIQHAAATLSARHAGQPEPPPFDPQAIAQATMQPSVPVLPLDFHAWEFAECKEWLSSSDCRRQIAEGNQRGVDNVTLHAMAHKKLADAEAGTQPPPAPPMRRPPVRVVPSPGAPAAPAAIPVEQSM